MLQEHLHLTTIQYGWITLALTVTILLTKLINTFLLEYIHVDKIVFYSLIVLLAACGLLLTFALQHLYTVETIVIPFILFGAGSGFLFSNGTVAAFRDFKRVASGSVSGLINCIQFLFAFVGSTIAAHIDITHLLPLALLLIMMTLLTFIFYICLDCMEK